MPSTEKHRGPSRTGCVCERAACLARKGTRSQARMDVFVSGWHAELANLIGCVCERAACLAHKRTRSQAELDVFVSGWHA